MWLLEDFGGQGIIPCVICTPPRDFSPMHFEDTGGRQSLFGSMTYHFSVFWGDFLIHVMQRHGKFVGKSQQGEDRSGMQWKGKSRIFYKTINGMPKIRNWGHCSRSFSIHSFIVRSRSKGATPMK